MEISVNRGVLCKILDTVGLSKMMVNIIRSMHLDTRAKNRQGNLIAEWVSERKVKQGCILYSSLFSLYIKEMAGRMRKINTGVKTDGDKICLLLYADNVVVMSEMAEELQSLLVDIVSGYGRDFGIKFSSEKSKVMILLHRSQDKIDNV